MLWYWLPGNKFGVISSRQVLVKGRIPAGLFIDLLLSRSPLPPC